VDACNVQSIILLAKPAGNLLAAPIVDINDPGVASVAGSEENMDDDNDMKNVDNDFFL
jgi:hypothetical protein